jgi:hypothetical protein
MDPKAFDQLWRQLQAVKFQMTEPQEELCSYAQHFAAWADALYQEEVNQPTLVGINQKMLLLLKRYFEWRAAVPKAHRDRMSERSHVCIFSIFERSFHRFKVLELSLAPPMLFLPPPAAPPPPPELAAITLGEIMGDA